MRVLFLGLAAAVLAAPTLAQPSATERVVHERLESEAGAYRVVQLVSGLEHPWAVAFLPDGRMLVTERPGRLALVTDGRVTHVEGLPRIHAENQGGLLDLVLHPDYAENGWIYFAYSSPGDNDSAIDTSVRHATGTALARARLSADGTRLEDLQTLYVTQPRHTPGRHYGTRIVFPGDGTVIFGIGDRGLRWPSQDLTDPAGSMIRIREDGGAAEDNPFVGVPPGNLRPEIWSYGHRSPQAMLIDPATGTFWSAEHGPRGGDVLFIYRRGANYGWPQVSQGLEYSTGEKVGLGREAPGVEQPVYVWEKAIAPSGMALYTGDAFPGWRGNLFVGSLVQRQVRRLVLDGERVTHEETLLDGAVGRVRDVRQGPDGLLYVVTDEKDGGVYRIEPAS
jgi:glucose/arabinose dehydrogenase